MHFPGTACAYVLLGVTLLTAGCGAEGPPMPLAGGEPDRGRATIQRYGCAGCHAIPGINPTGANVGPPLAQLAKRGYIAGFLPNTPDNLVRWVLDPPAVDPRTAMPRLGLSAAEAADVAAYLYTAR